MTQFLEAGSHVDGVFADRSDYGSPPIGCEHGVM
jgi:hypothetical protein